MFSVFSVSPTTSNIQQENNIQARKPSISNRKPLADRRNDNDVPLKPILQSKTNQKLNEVNKESSLIDICSYKEVSDSYNDTMGPKNFNLVNSFVSGRLAKTPPPKKHHFEPDLIENEYYFNYDFISKENPIENIEFLQIDDVPLPNINFVF